jgi:hypothetical protein
MLETTATDQLNREVQADVQELEKILDILGRVKD